MAEQEITNHPNRALGLENTAYTLKDVAGILGVPLELVRHWCDGGRIVAAKTQRGGHWKIHPSHVPSREGALQALREEAVKAFAAIEAECESRMKHMEAVMLDAREGREAVERGELPVIGDDLKAAYDNHFDRGQLDGWLLVGNARRYAEWLDEAMEPQDLPIDEASLIR
ncbi:MAG: hypothetical protein QOD07_1873 [Frankiaceae bacterium]|jgi:hypothetical protein|nr:hypothetical protein [Frankiaceae bacterium]